jgi:hypothetical protein
VAEQVGCLYLVPQDILCTNNVLIIHASYLTFAPQGQGNDIRRVALSAHTQYLMATIQTGSFWRCLCSEQSFIVPHLSLISMFRTLLECTSLTPISQQ